MVSRFGPPVAPEPSCILEALAMMPLHAYEVVRLLLMTACG